MRVFGDWLTAVGADVDAGVGVGAGADHAMNDMC